MLIGNTWDNLTEVVFPLEAVLEKMIELYLIVLGLVNIGKGRIWGAFIVIVLFVWRAVSTLYMGPFPIEVKQSLFFLNAFIAVSYVVLIVIYGVIFKRKFVYKEAVSKKLVKQI